MKTRISILVFTLLGCISCSGNIIKVGKHQQYLSIREAIHAAINGDTLWIDSGNYQEKNIVIDKSITIIGKDYPVLDGEAKTEIISVKQNRVTIKGLKLIRSGISSLQDIAAIKIYNCRDVVIENNIIEDAFFGIYVQGGTNCRIENNRLKASSQTEQRSGNGIHCWKCDSMQ